MTEETDIDRPVADRPSRRPGELPMLLLMALFLAFVIKTFLVQAFYIPSGSMIPTLQVNDRVLVEKVTYRFREPERGDVIVFRREGAEVRRGPMDVLRNFLEGLGLVPPDADIDLIKRIVGLPGETIEIRDGVVRIDGAPLDEPYAASETRDFPPTLVPPGEFFMLGDNRSNSEDSRYGLGTVPRANVVGRAFLILWPPSRATVEVDHDY